jgi:hypothetical protein
VNLLLDKKPLIIKVYDEKIFQLHECDFIYKKGRVKIIDFGAEIIVERVVTNDWNEKVLEGIEESPIKGLDSTIYHAVDKIADYLDGKSKLDSTGTLFHQTELTMDILWQSKSKIL